MMDDSSRSQQRIMPADPAAPDVILASASPSRRMLLVNAGVPVSFEAAQVDEGAVKQALQAEGADAAQVAETLAELKAQRVARRHPLALVIGADQMLDCNGVWFDKPADLAQAATHLEALSDRAHELDRKSVV